MKYLIILIALCSMACAKDDKPYDKNLFSYWSSTDGDHDLTGMSFNLYEYVNINSGVAKGCTCSVDIRGTQSEGVIQLFHCARNQPTDTCFGTSISFNYTKTATTLTTYSSLGVYTVYQ